MKILIVDGSNYIDFPPGGIKFYTRNFVKAISYYHFVSLVGLTTDKNEKIGKWSYREIDGKQIRFLPIYFIDNKEGTHKKPIMPIRIGTAWGLWQQKNTIDLSEFDFVYVHFPELCIPFAFPFKKIKIAFHLHGTIREAATKSRYGWIRNPFFAKMFYQVNKWIIGKSDIVFTISQEGLDLIKSIFPEKEHYFQRVPVMIDTSVFCPLNHRNELRKKYGFKPNEKIIIFTGRAEPKKKIDLLIKYLYLLSPEISNLRLVVAGSGSDYDRLVKIAHDLKIADRVKFWGEVEHDTVLPEILNCADVYAFTSSIGEGFPASIVEALACGIPVLSHDLGDINKVINNGKTGYLLKDGDFQDFKEKLYLVFENQNELSKNAFLQAQEYSLQNVSHRICKALEGI